MQKDIQRIIDDEKQRQSEFIELIASENYQSMDVLAAQSTVFANKYAEWFPWKRYYGGQQNTDKIEVLAIESAKEIFHADHANVQALSGAAANLWVYNTLMQPGDSILGMDLSHWGHLTHGSSVTLVSKIYKFHNYKTTNGKVDFDRLRQIALDVQPKVILAWFSAYSRNLDRSKFVEIAKEVWAITFADVSHIGGFIAAGILENPLDHGFHVMMTTTHKSLRWPRWALILSKWVVRNPMKKLEKTIENIPTRIDRSIFPGIQWWPHMHSIAAIAVALEEAKTSEFKEYAEQTLKNAQILSQELIKYWYSLVTGWTENHMVIIDFFKQWLNGRQIQQTLEKVNISSSASMIPDDSNPPYKPSWLRLWTAAMTTRGVKESDIKKIVSFIDEAIKNHNNDELLSQIKGNVISFAKWFPLPQ